jgi:hypothetical protein
MRQTAQYFIKRMSVLGYYSLSKPEILHAICYNQQDLKFSQWLCCGFQSSGMWHCVVAWVVPDALEDQHALMQTKKKSSSFSVWRWFQQDPSERWEPVTQWHSITTHKTVILLRSFVMVVCWQTWRHTKNHYHSKHLFILLKYSTSFPWHTASKQFDRGSHLETDRHRNAEMKCCNIMVKFMVGKY